ncbi:MAG: hypothetical protein M3O34_03775 [Chloroflexota bacterium]|nr:hypothetical protein [Chloroflexota bacterium]
MHDIDPETLERILDGRICNLIRRGDDGSLTISADKWRLAERTPTTLTFVAEPPAPADVPPLMIELADVDRLAWDRLPKQQTRSQVRVYLHNGDVVTFSGALADPSESTES